ncbi:CRISPR-associated endoribonuclease Cas6 [Thermoplasmatales archaeon]|nr:CRISPR-associated endoribonuclease Cas6 [Thermoplasmatales archaeon]
MLTSIISIERSDQNSIPFEYNYYLAISVYSKLKLYQEEIKTLHKWNQPGIHTISNIIARSASHRNNGLDISRGFFILRSIDKRMGSYFRLGLSIDPYLRIGSARYIVKSVTDSDGRLRGRGNVGFKTLSPVLIRNFQNKKMFVAKHGEIEENLNQVMKWTLKNQFGIAESNLSDLFIKVTEAHSKTIRISSGPAKESMTRGYDITGNISGDPGVLEVIYHRGLGSKTGLGLGCWEAI